MKSFQTSFWAWLDKSLTFNVIYLPIVYIEHGLFKKKKKMFGLRHLGYTKMQTNKQKQKKPKKLTARWFVIDISRCAVENMANPPFYNVVWPKCTK